MRATEKRGIVQWLVIAHAEIRATVENARRAIIERDGHAVVVNRFRVRQKPEIVHVSEIPSRGDREISPIFAVQRLPVREELCLVLGDERLHVVSLVVREVAFEFLSRQDVKGGFLALIPGMDVRTVVTSSL